MAAVVGLYAWGLARAAWVADRDRLERLVSARAVEVEERAPERLGGPENRRGGVSSLSRQRAAHREIGNLDRTRLTSSGGLRMSMLIPVCG